MNILYVVNTWPKLSESFILNEVVELSDRGHNVAVFSINKGDSEIQHTEFSQKQITAGYSTASELHPKDLFRASSLGKHLIPTLETAQGLASEPRELAKGLIRGAEIQSFIDALEWCPEIIHAHFLASQSLGAQFAGSALNIPTTTTAHAYDIWRDDMNDSLSERMSSLDRVLTISDAHRRYLQNRTHTHVQVVHCGIRSEKFTPTDETVTNRFVTVSRFVEKKGLAYGVAAISELVSDYPDIEWHIIGGGPNEEEIRSAIESFGISDHVTLLDHVTDDELISELDAAEFFLLPSVVASNGDRDGIPVAAMEAMAMETVPILGRVNSTTELINHSSNGFVADTRCGKMVSPRFIEIIRSAIESDTSTIGARARETIVSDFNIKNTVENLEDIFIDISK
ncbi:glycosyltransferase [Haloferax sp. ATB1]|uniref:glycosyltransferase n=1 Tax=Haloferax sp. ATB1 TaxID=1508454 RepID=UPI0009E30080|nr:glycosyltransferase [Haloferax sp. ATB1]